MPVACPPSSKPVVHDLAAWSSPCASTLRQPMCHPRQLSVQGTASSAAHPTALPASSRVHPNPQAFPSLLHLHSCRASTPAASASTCLSTATLCQSGGWCGVRTVSAPTLQPARGTPPASASPTCTISPSLPIAACCRHPRTVYSTASRRRRAHLQLETRYVAFGCSSITSSIHAFTCTIRLHSMQWLCRRRAGVGRQERNRKPQPRPRPTDRLCSVSKAHLVKPRLRLSGRVVFPASNPKHSRPTAWLALTGFVSCGRCLAPRFSGPSLA